MILETSEDFVKDGLCPGFQPAYRGFAIRH